MNNNLKKYLTLIILGLAGGSIYIFPYLKYVFYDPLIQVLHISDTQSGLLLTMYAIGCVILYIPGGILADKMNPKKALMLSLAVATILTGAFAVTILLDLPGSVAYGISLVIWLLIAFASGFVFWTAILKAIRRTGYNVWNLLCCKWYNSSNYCSSKLMGLQCRWWRFQYEVRLLLGSSFNGSIYIIGNNFNSNILRRKVR